MKSDNKLGLEAKLLIAALAGGCSSTVSNVEVETPAPQYVPFEHTNEEGWEYVCLARDSEDRNYTAFAKGNEVVYVGKASDGKYVADLVFSRQGKIIGFYGEDQKMHLHSPSLGWGRIDFTPRGLIKNKFEGDGGIPDFELFKTPDTSVYE